MSIMSTIAVAAISNCITTNIISAHNAFIAERNRHQAEMEAEVARLQERVDETEEVKTAINTVRNIEGELLELRRKLRAAKAARANPYVEVRKEIKGYSPAYFETLIRRKEEEMKMAETTLLATRRAVATFITELGEMPKAPKKTATYDTVKHQKSLKRRLDKIDSDIKALEEKGKNAEESNEMGPNNGENTETAENPSKQQDKDNETESNNSQSQNAETASKDNAETAESNMTTNPDKMMEQVNELAGYASDIKAIEKEINDATQQHNASSYTFTKLSSGARRYLIFAQAQQSMRPRNQIGLIKSESGFIFIPMTKSMLQGYKPENIENGVYKLRIPFSYNNGDLLTELVISD